MNFLQEVQIEETRWRQSQISASARRQAKQVEYVLGAVKKSIMDKVSRNNVVYRHTISCPGVIQTDESVFPNSVSRERADEIEELVLYQMLQEGFGFRLRYDYPELPYVIVLTWDSE